MAAVRFGRITLRVTPRVRRELVHPACDQTGPAMQNQFPLAAHDDVLPRILRVCEPLLWFNLMLPPEASDGEMFQKVTGLRFFRFVIVKAFSVS